MKRPVKSVTKAKVAKKPRRKREEIPVYDEFAKDLENAPIFDGREILPILVRSGEGVKIEGAAGLFGVNEFTMRRTAKRFRCYRQTYRLATIYVLLPAVSAIHARDWTAFRLLQEGHRGEHPRLQRHYKFIADMEEEKHRLDVAEAKGKGGSKG